MDYGATHLTAKKTKIKSLGKQSKFEGSDREVRGRILKQLTGNATVLGKQYSSWDEKRQRRVLLLSDIVQEFPHKEIPKILQTMEADHLIRYQDHKIWIE